MTPVLNPRLAKLRLFLANHGICVFGRRAMKSDRITYCELPEGSAHNPARSHDRLKHGVLQFLNSDHQSLAAVLSDELTDHPSAHIAAKRLFCQLGIVCAEISHPEVSARTIAASWLAMCGAALFIPSARIRDPFVPLAGLDGRERLLFCMLMAPTYDLKHPRYSPVPVLFATPQEDIEAAALKHPALAHEITRSCVELRRQHLDHDATPHALDPVNFEQRLAVGRGNELYDWPILEESGHAVWYGDS